MEIADMDFLSPEAQLLQVVLHSRSAYDAKLFLHNQKDSLYWMRLMSSETSNLIQVPVVLTEW